jgi:alginate O-acetyltransferase complex protein AlgI
VLFNSYDFILVFIPAVACFYYLLGYAGWYRSAIGWLVLASLFFYGWWNPVYVLLLVVSIAFNFLLGRVLSAGYSDVTRKFGLILGIGANLGALAYFKYANFFVDNINAVLETGYHLERIILPLAISFFTFQQITYLVDASKKQVQEPNFLRYCLFVTFFPQLIAGPIVHHGEMLPQFSQRSVFRFNHAHLAVGATVFVLGLFKKVVIADEMAVYATPVFDAAQAGVTLTFFAAWGGALAYTFQLYFDFSGYSDMAVGLAYLFGIRLPLNFFSPYKARNIIEFWRRWHISLSRFLRDYVYIPLGGSRLGDARRYTNLMTTMVLGGLWHGAGWTFVAWGALHGLYLMINHGWHAIRRSSGRPDTSDSWVSVAFGQVLTFLAVVVAWVFFRAESFPAAMSILNGMSGANGILLPASWLDHLNRLIAVGAAAPNLGPLTFSETIHHFPGFVQQLQLLALLVIAWFAPNVYQLLGRYSPALDITHVTVRSEDSARLGWTPGVLWAIALFAMLYWSLAAMDRTSEFLYFQF